jgi:hypothetical protein
MKKTVAEENAPGILGATDLVHLHADQRLSLLGPDRWMSRREALVKLLGAAAMVALPSVVLTGCGGGGGSSDSAAAPPGNSSGTTTGDSSGSTSGGSTGASTATNASAPGNASTFYVADILANTSGASNSPSVSVLSNNRITLYNHTLRVILSKPPKSISNLGSSMSLDAPNAFYSYFSFESMPTLWFTVGQPSNWENNKVYTIRISGTFMSQDDQLLDGNKDGIGGDDFVKTFTAIVPSSTGGSTTPGNTCSTNVTCSSWGGSTCFCEVQCGCQLYRV